tara:strand:- start:418 stop:978 length:561 start_codon:yes stop_codon:yes gene_type:complete
MFLICGLGNPGKEYIDTRHNIGFALIDKLVIFYNFILYKKDSKKEMYKGVINNNSCFLLKPLNFMNLSGQPIREVMNFYKIEKKRLFIVHDDLDLELGKVKVKVGGGNGGHNGLSNIDEMIGNDYYRIRIGIDHPGEKHLVSNYVLNKFNETETDIINKQLNNITQNFELVLSDTGLFLTKLSENK